MAVEWTDRPALRRPVLIAAFEGWNDAGSAASDAIEFLVETLGATETARFDPEEWFDFQAARPQVVLANGVVRSLSWPRVVVSTAGVPGIERDVVLLQGSEPNLRWPAFCEEVLALAGALGCDFVITLGALLSDTPHTRPVPVTGTSQHRELAERLGLEPSSYEGPTGIVGVLHEACTRHGVPSVSLWASIPHYVSAPPNPKGQLALLSRLSELLDLPLALARLEFQAQTWEHQVNEAAAGDDSIIDYVRDLERRYDADRLPFFDPDFARRFVEASDDDWDDDEDDDDEDDWDDWVDALDWEDDKTLPSGESLAEDFERFLRDQQED